MDMDVDVTKIEYIEYGCGCGWHIQNHYQYSKKLDTGVWMSLCLCFTLNKALKQSFTFP